MRNIRKRYTRSGEAYWEISVHRKGIRHHGGVCYDELSAIAARTKLEALHPIQSRVKTAPANISAALSGAW